MKCRRTYSKAGQGKPKKGTARQGMEMQRNTNINEDEIDSNKM